MSLAHDYSKSAKSFAAIDTMPPELRRCVHEYGYAIVHACLNAGVSDPRRVHQLVREIWDGARQPRQRRPHNGTIDWLLIQSGCEIGTDTLYRVFWNADLMIVPRSPTAAMLSASMATVSGHNVICTKAEKHRRRLTAAIEAGAINQ